MHREGNLIQNMKKQRRRGHSWRALLTPFATRQFILPITPTSQFNTLTVEQDINNLMRDCEEKNTTIKEITSPLNSSEVANNKRVAELEDIICRKNMFEESQRMCLQRGEITW